MRIEHWGPSGGLPVIISVYDDKKDNNEDGTMTRKNAGRKFCNISVQNYLLVLRFENVNDTFTHGGYVQSCRFFRDILYSWLWCEKPPGNIDAPPWWHSCVADMSAAPMTNTPSNHSCRELQTQQIHMSTHWYTVNTMPRRLLRCFA